MFFQLISRLSVAGILVVAAVIAPAFAGDVNLSWNPSSGATGYKVHSGGSAGNYGPFVDVGNVTQATYSGMADCAATYFAVTAHNTAGDSGFSNEVSSWPRPVLSGTSDAEAQRGDQLNLVITGMNFQPGASLQFSNPDIAINSMTIDACGQITSSITVGSSAAFGPTEISVVNPNGVTGTAAGLFSVVGDPLPNVPNLRRTDKK